MSDTLTSKDASEPTFGDRLRRVAAELRSQAETVEAVAFSLEGQTLPPVVGMPAVPLRTIDQAIAIMGRRGVRSAILRMEPRLIRELSVRLVQPGMETQEARQWLSEQLGEPVPHNRVYRYARKLRGVLDELLPGPASDPASASEPTSPAMIRTALAELRRRSRNRLLELPDEVLVPFLVEFGDGRGPLVAARRRLEGQTGRKVNVAQLHHLRQSLASILAAQADQARKQAARERAAHGPDRGCRVHQSSSSSARERAAHGPDPRSRPKNEG